MDVSLNQWITLLKGMELGLHGSTLTGFYRLCRALLVKNETEFDRFDQAFLEYFKDIPWKGEIPDDLMSWLNEPVGEFEDIEEELNAAGISKETLEQLLDLLEERLKEQKEEHDGGSYWVGTHGRSRFGNSGWNPNTIRVGGKSKHRAAMLVAGERKFRDFRKDNTLDTRHFQMAFRTLRQMSVRNDMAEQEVDVDGTIRDTCDSAGTLKIRYRKPRKNTVKVLLLMDSGGSMDYYSRICSMLFQAATKSNRFKELHTYYFHNCIYSNLYTHPDMRWESVVRSEWVLKNYDESYKVIIVGDAAMSPGELTAPRYSWTSRAYGISGLAWLELFKKRFPYIVWLNPVATPTRPDFWTQTHFQLAQMFKMFTLSAEGLELSMKELMRR